VLEGLPFCAKQTDTAFGAAVLYLQHQLSNLLPCKAVPFLCPALWWYGHM